MKSSSKSAKLFVLIIVLIVATLVPFAKTRLAGANSISLKNRESFVRVNEFAPISGAPLKPALFFSTYTVNSLGDTGAGSGTTGDLRYCITEANSAGGSNVINFSVIGTITLVSALPSIGGDLTINGPGANLLTVNGNNAVRVFATSSPTNTVTFSNLTIADGNDGNFGGGIYHTTSGTVNITNCVVRACVAHVGGGIFNSDRGTINITNTTVRNCSTTGSNGGGLYNNVQGTINVTGSTFNDNNTNVAGSGAGIFNNDNVGSHINITNSTFSSNNSPFGVGGGFYSAGGAATVTNCTFTNNSASSGSGIGRGSGTLQIKNCLVAQNSDSDLGGSITSLGYNLIGNNSTVGGNFPAGLPNGNNDYVGTDASTINALLGPLAANGGPTFTHALLGGSPAIDKGSAAAGVTTDQRGFTRSFNNPVISPAPGGNDSDIGAFESQIVQCTNASFTQASGSPINLGSIPPASIVTGDFNLDGKLDLATADSSANNVTILLGNGSGGFSQPIGSPVGVGTTPMSLAIGDFNLDGKPDLVTANRDSNNVTVLLGNGSGGFSPAVGSPFAALSAPYSVAVGDFNLDGKPDLVTANNSTGNVTILLGNGSGGFTQAGGSPVNAGQYPYSVAVGDFNLDGKPDVAVALQDSASVAVLLGNGSGGFSHSASSPVSLSGIHPYSIVVGDFNLDGKPDLATANSAAGNVSILTGNGSGGFAVGSPIAAGAGALGLTVGDLNSDGRPDLAVTNPSAGNVTILLGNGSGGFTQPTGSPISAGADPRSVAIGDFNLDFRPDLAIANNSSFNVTIQLTTCANTPPTITAQAGLSRQRGSTTSNSQIATVNDTESGAGGVTVTVTSANPSNGVTISNIINTGGNITADIVATCAATDASFTLQASDGSLTATATLNVTLTANTPPTLTYANQSVAFGGSLNISPMAAIDNGSIDSYAIQSVVPPLTTAPTVSGVGIVSITNAQPTGDHVITIHATDNCGVATDGTFTLTVNNALPTIVSAGPLSRQQGSLAINSQIATVSDANQAANTLNVSATPLTGTGVSVDVISIAANGNVTADVSASCTATNSTFTLTVTDNQSATATTTLTVNVTANTPPTVSYPGSQTVAFGGSLNVGPATAIDNGSVTGYTIQSVIPALATAPTVNASGVVSISSAQPSGNHVITIQATDNCGATTDAAFTLSVGSAPPAITAAGPLSRQRGSAAINSQIAVVSDTEDAPASLAVSVNNSATATVNGVTVSNLTVDGGGIVKADVAASCTATNASFTLKVTDSGGLMNTATLDVTVTPNPAPTLGSYSNQSLSLGAGTSVMPTASPADNNSIAGVSASAPNFTGTLLVNSLTGVVTIAGAGPVGTFTVTVAASDNCGAIVTRTFQLTVSGESCAHVSLGTPVSFGAGNVPIHVAVGDFNLDGQTDVAVANLTSNDVTILLNNGSGGFTQPVGSPLGPFLTAESVAVGDFNLDGKPDLAILNGGASTVTIMLGNGSGGFTQAVGSPVNTGSASFPFAMVVGDFNLDGKPDLATANGGSNNVTVLLGDGSGGLALAPGSPFPAGTRPRSIAAGDFNLDNKLDLAVANETSGDLTILLGNGSGGFAQAVGSPIATGASPHAVTVCDFNLDTKPDIAVANQGSSNVTILLGNGSGGFAQPVGSPITGVFAAYVLAPADFNLDGKPDIAVQIAITGESAILVGNGSGGFTVNILTTGVNPQSLAVGDFNLDGKPDLVSANFPSNDVTTMLNICVSNEPPTISVVPLSRARGSAASNSQIATVGDVDQPANTLSLEIMPLSGTGVSVTGISIAENGIVTADVAASCAATDSSFTLKVTDNGELMTTATLVVTTTPDVTPPTVTCPANITQSTAANQCTAVVNFSTTTDDNCPGTTVLCDHASGSTFAKGVTTVICTATDAAGNQSAPCSFTVTINDTQSPVITCPANVTKSTDPNQCTAVVTYTNATATDNCPNVGTPVCTPASGSTFSKGITTVNCTVSDAADNHISCSFSVTVNDTQNPAITCPANITQSNDSGQCSAVLNYSAPAGSDNCPLPPNAVVCTPAPGATFQKGVTTVSCVVTDSAGLTANCSFTVTVNDTQPPAMTCPSNVTVGNTPGQCTGVASYVKPNATDNCPNVGSVTCTPASGSTFAKGVTTVSCSVSDASGNPATCSFTVTVNDTQPPVISCPANITKATDANLCSAVVSFSSTATDNCANVGTPVCTPASGSTFAKGVTTVSCTVNDASSNTANCSFTVTVNDTQAPAISCPANITQPSATGQCSSIVSFANATATDNCPNVGTPGCSPASGSTFPKGTTTVSCSVSDASGNQSSCSFTVTVTDTQKPTVTCPGNITKATDPNVCSSVVTFSATAADNCPGSTASCNPPSGSVFAKGSTSVTCTATDASGNISTPCTFTVTINDTQAPAITCPANVSKVTDPNLCSAVAIFAAPTVSDNCPGVGNPVCTPASGSAFPKGITTVVCTVKDSSNNQAACSFTVAVNDTQAPTIACPPNQTRALANPTDTTVVVTYPAPVVGDNCPGATVACSPPSGSALPIGTTTVTCTATDAANNKSSCSFAVIIFDVCLQDDSNSATVILFNSITGDYLFCCGGATYSGRGTVQKQGSTYTLTHNPADRRVSARLEGALNKGTASLQSPPGTMKGTINDRDVRNNSCVCTASNP